MFTCFIVPLSPVRSAPSRFSLCLFCPKLPSFSVLHSKSQSRKEQGIWTLANALIDKQNACCWPAAAYYSFTCTSEEFPGKVRYQSHSRRNQLWQTVVRNAAEQQKTHLFWARTRDCLILCPVPVTHQRMLPRKVMNTQVLTMHPQILY